MNIKLLFAIVVVALGASRVSANNRVQVLDENGKPLCFVRSVSLAPGHIAVPAETFESFGLRVRYRPEEKRVYVSAPRTAVQIAERSATPPKGFMSGDHQIYNPIRGYLPKRYSYPLASNQDGRFYLSVNVLCQLFPQRFTSKWNSNTRSLVLQRRVSSVKVW